MSKNKKVKGQSVSGNKNISLQALKTEKYYDKYPKWAFSKCDFEHEKWGVSCNHMLDNLLIALRNFEGMSWGEILGATNGRNHNTRSHHVPIENLDDEAVERLKELNLDDYDELCSLAVDGRKRVWGVINDGVYNIIWYDLNHEICESKKRHT